MQAGYAGYRAFRRSFSDPSQSDFRRTYFEYGDNRYAQYWAYYANSLFDKASSFNWEGYKSANRLYRNIRSLENPARQLVEFYAAKLYPGTITKDGLPSKKGKPSAIPFSEDTDPALIAAIAQIWQWSNWQLLKSLQIRYCAALGDVLTEVVDDVEKGKVWLDVIWPGFVKDLDLDHVGNVQMYAVEYPVSSETIVSAYQKNWDYYLYRKEVDKQTIRYYKDGVLFDYGNGAEIANPYGFVPAVWIRHQPVGTIHGVPAIAGSEPLFDELNGLLCMIIDQVERILRAPSILWGAVNARGLAQSQKRGATSELTDQQNDQESVGYITGAQGGHRESLLESLDFAGVDISVGRLLTAIEGNHPELTFWRQLREMSQVTGPAAERLTGDVTAKVVEAQANYDQQNISLWRMAVAIAGMRANSGAWGQLSPQQQKFSPFDLSSYERGDLDMAIAERPLLAETRLEHAQTVQTFWNAAGVAVQNAGVPIEWFLSDEGYSEEQIAGLRARQDAQAAQIQQDQLLAQQDFIPQTPQ